MKKLLLSGLLALFLPSIAQAACYADYKAKRDNPLRLHYGVVALQGDCTVNAARAYLAPRLAAEGWKLLNVVSLFDEAGLEERRKSASDYYLRY